MISKLHPNLFQMLVLSMELGSSQLAGHSLTSPAMARARTSTSPWQPTKCASIPIFTLSIASDGEGSHFPSLHRYRLRIINSGSLAPIRFSVDYHVLTVIEADGTAVEPFDVASVSVQVAQRYSVLLHTNQTADAYWMRAVLDESMFAYTK